MTNPSRSKRPYLIRAMHEWMGDNGHTPHIVVDASIDGVNVPREHIKDGKIILNISDTAAHNLKLTNDGASFRARFSGVPVSPSAIRFSFRKRFSTGEKFKLFITRYIV